MAIPGLFFAFKQHRRIAVMLAVTTVLVLLQVAAFHTWFGGNAVGPRYLAPALPFLALAAAYGIQRFPEMGLILTIVSIGMMGMVTAIAIDPPSDVLTPLQSYYLARIDQHRFADNLGTLAGWPLWVSLALPLGFAALATWRVLTDGDAHV
jgi:hypothetical protein